MDRGAEEDRRGLRRQRLQRALVVAQIAVSVMLLTGAGLLTRTMQRLANVDTGLSTERVLTMERIQDTRIDDVKTIRQKGFDAIAQLQFKGADAYRKH